MQWAWVRVLGVEPSRRWRDGRSRCKAGRRMPGKRVLRELFENRERVDLDDRS